MVVRTRRECREQLGTLLNAALTGSGNPAQAVYDYVIKDPQGLSPVTVVGATGSAPPVPDGIGLGNTRQPYRYDIMNFVLRSEQTDTDDLLDAMYNAVLTVLEDNASVTGYWYDLRQSGDSSITTWTSPGGDQYWLEIIPVELRVD